MTIHYDMPEGEYHVPGWHGIHALMDYAKHGPAYFHAHHITGERERESNVVFTMGSACHAAVLEGLPAYEERYAVGGPINEKTGKPYGSDTKAYAAWLAEIGKPAISEVEGCIVRGMVGAISKNSAATDLLGSGSPEVTFRQQHGALFMQCRVDWLAGTGTEPWDWTALVDYKTVSDLSTFDRDVFRYGYDQQAAHYQWMVEEEAGVVLPWAWIIQEKKWPYASRVVWCPPEILAHARDENMRLRDDIEKALELDIWPINTVESYSLAVPHWIGGGE